jgi:glucokinase
MVEDVVIAVDMGGTHVRTALVAHDDEILARHEGATQAEKGPDDLVRRIVATARCLAEEVGGADATAVGVSAPGPLDPARGVILWAPNLPGWRDVPLAQMLQAALDRPVHMGNDGNLAALAEQRRGAARGHDDVVYITVGTGVGGGLIGGGHLLVGQGFGGEVGHMVVDPDGPRCNCGNRGCLEAVASGMAIARQARGLLEAGAQTAIRELAGGDPGAADARLVHQAARQGDAIAVDLFRRAGVALGIGAANLVYLLNPSIIVVGGSVAKAGDLLLVPMRATLSQRVPPLYWRNCPIVPAALAGDAGLVGAAILAREDGLPGR